MAEKNVMSILKSQDAPKIAPYLEKKLREELGLSEQLGYEVKAGSGSPANFGTLLNDSVKLIIGGSANQLFAVNFSLVQPRPFNLHIQVLRRGIGAGVGGLFYFTQLSRLINDPVALQSPKSFGSAKFTGDSKISALLNTDTTLLKRINKFAQDKIAYTGVIFSIQRTFQLQPDPGGAQLIAYVMPKLGGISGKLSLEAKEFVELAATIENML